MQIPGLTIDREALSKHQLWQVSKHYCDTLDTVLQMNNQLIQHLNGMGVTSAMADAINGWAAEVNNLMSASSREVRLIIEPEPATNLQRN